jgi:hypothetical protein
LQSLHSFRLDVNMIFKASKVVLGGLVVSVLAIGPKVRWLKPGRREWISMGNENLKCAFLLRGSTAVGPLLTDFKAC